MADEPGRTSASATTVASLPVGRLERIRHVVSLCGQAVVRAYDQDALLSEQCHLLVDIGGYHGVQVLLAAEDGALRRAAQAGHIERQDEDGQEDGQDRRGEQADLDPRVAALARRAVDARQPITAPRARASDLRVCLLPLQFAAHGRGVLLVAAGEADALGPEEIALLRELSGNLEHGITVLRDRAAKEALEEELREAKQRYAAIFEHTREGVFVASRCGTLHLANPAFARLIGYASADELISTPAAGLAAIMTPPDKRRLTEAIDRDGKAEFELPLRHRDGSRVWVAMSAQRVEEAEGTRIQGFVQDLTPIRGEREKTQLLAAIVDATEEAVLSKDPDGRITCWNRGAELLLGYSFEEVVGRPATELIIPPGLEDEEKRVLAEVRAGERVPLFDTQRRCKDGTIIDVATSMSPIFDDAGRVTGVAVVAHNISERKRDHQTQLALERQEAEVRQLQELAKMRMEFINEAAHELKTPLTPIITHVYLLKSRPDLDESTAKSLRVIERNAHRVQALVKDLVDASRLEAGRLKLEPENVDIADLVGAALRAVEEQREARQMHITTHVAGLGAATVDAARVTQVLLTILENAIRFSPDGGNIGVEGKAEEEWFTIRVVDHGLGLTDEQLTTLFQPFAVIPQTGSAQGTGLGLFIARGIVEAHGGTIWAQSEGHGRGMILAFRMPRHPRAAAQQERGAPPAMEPTT